jgi:hypothetical protein
VAAAAIDAIQKLASFPEGIVRVFIVKSPKLAYLNLNGR